MDSGRSRFFRNEAPLPLPGGRDNSPFASGCSPGISSSEKQRVRTDSALCLGRSGTQEEAKASFPCHFTSTNSWKPSKVSVLISFVVDILLGAVAPTTLRQPYPAPLLASKPAGCPRKVIQQPPAGKGKARLLECKGERCPLYVFVPPTLTEWALYLIPPRSRSSYISIRPP